jgi:IS1 family transposase
MATKKQLFSYMKKIMATSKYKMYGGRRVKAYQVPGTEEFKKYHTASIELANLILEEDIKRET